MIERSWCLPLPNLDVPTANGSQLTPVRAEQDAGKRLRLERQGEQLFAGPDVPYLDRPVPAPGRESLAVRGKGHGNDRSNVAFKSMEERAGLGVPKLDRLVPARRGQETAIRTKCQVDHIPRMAR